MIRSTASSAERRTDKELREIGEFWNQIRCEELDATSWGVLGPLEREAAEAMWQNPPDLVKARSATVQAICHLTETDKL
jgi:hypothetical protein